MTQKPDFDAITARILKYTKALWRPIVRKDIEFFAAAQQELEAEVARAEQEANKERIRALSYSKVITAFKESYQMTDKLIEKWEIQAASRQLGDLKAEGEAAGYRRVRQHLHSQAVSLGIELRPKDKP